MQEHMRSSHTGHINSIKAVGGDGGGEDDDEKSRRRSLLPRLRERQSFLDKHIELQRADQFANAH